MFISFLFAAMQKEKKQNQSKEKHATTHQGSAPNPVSSLCYLLGEFAHQTKTFFVRRLRLS